MPPAFGRTAFTPLTFAYSEIAAVAGTNSSAASAREALLRILLGSISPRTMNVATANAAAKRERNEAGR